MTSYVVGIILIGCYDSEYAFTVAFALVPIQFQLRHLAQQSVRTSSSTSHYATYRYRHHHHRTSRSLALDLGEGVSQHEVNNESESESDSVNGLDQDNKATKELAFFDEAFIFVRAGSGGQGSSTFKKAKRGDREAKRGDRESKRGADGIPDGGNGGVGGNVIMVADYSLNTLAGLTLGWRPNSFGGSGASYKQADSQKAGSSDRIKSFKAMTGFDGSRRFHNGSNGEDVEIRVPPGTTVQEEVEFEDEEGNVIGHEMVDIRVLTLENPTLVVAQGGKGGDGSGMIRKATAAGKKLRRSPPQRGERKKLKLVLKIVADVALVGVPNAGKSTFLASVTRAKPKIANYPFTTVIPNLGVWVPTESDYASATASKGITAGAGSAGLVLCVS